GRGRGRQRLVPREIESAPPTAGPIAPRPPVARAAFDYSDLDAALRAAFDYSDLDAALREAEAAMRRTRHTLDQLAGGGWKPEPGDALEKEPAMGDDDDTGQ
ncbi:hypothetical protein ACFHPP_27605, partial [Falsiroseomonas sp. E2-1-a20]